MSETDQIMHRLLSDYFGQHETKTRYPGNDPENGPACQHAFINGRWISRADWLYITSPKFDNGED